jgi:hypothetical protein
MSVEKVEVGVCDKKEDAVVGRERELRHALSLSLSLRWWWRFVNLTGRNQQGQERSEPWRVETREGRS